MQTNQLIWRNTEQLKSLEKGCYLMNIFQKKVMWTPNYKNGVVEDMKNTVYKKRRI
jgi:hypothetical protein